MMYKNELLLRTLRVAGIKRLKYVFHKSGAKVLCWPTYKTKHRLSQWDSTTDQEITLSELVWCTWVAIKNTVPDLIGEDDASIVVVFHTQCLRIHVYKAHQKDAPSISGSVIFGNPVIWNFVRLKARLDQIRSQPTQS